MILFPFYDINLDLENVCYKDASWDISLVWRMCLPQRKDTQFQLRCFSCLLWAVTVFPEASVRFSPLDSICSRLCNPPHLPPFVREVQLFFSGESRGVFNTQSPSLPWFYFSLLCILFLINPVLQNEIGVRTWEWPDLKISLFFLSFLLLMTLIHPGILEVAAAGCSNVFLYFSFLFFFFSTCLRFEGLYQCLFGPLLIVQNNTEWSSPRNTPAVVRGPTCELLREVAAF